METKRKPKHKALTFNVFQMVDPDGMTSRSTFELEIGRKQLISN